MCDDGIGGSVKWEVAKHLTNVPTYQRTNVTFGKLYVRSIGEKITLYYIYYIFIYNIYNIKLNIPSFYRFHFPIENSKWYVGTLVRNEEHKKYQKFFEKKSTNACIYQKKVVTLYQK